MAVVSAAGLLLLQACGAPQSYRVRMTVEVDTPQGVRSGSGVFEIHASRALALLPQEHQAEIWLRGEAVPIDLPGGQQLFALLRPADDRGTSEGNITGALDPAFRGGAADFLASVARLSAPAMVGRSAALPPGSYPLLVRFRDPAIPGSVEVPGAGTRIRAIRLVITDEPVTSGLENRLPWLGTLRHNLDGSSATFSRNLANNLSSTDFKRGR